MKLSVSLPDDDVAFLDAYAKTHGVGSRSAMLQKAVGMLRASELGSAYEDAFREWRESGDAGAWDATVGDGLRGR